MPGRVPSQPLVSCLIALMLTAISIGVIVVPTEVGLVLPNGLPAPMLA